MGKKARKAEGKVKREGRENRRKKREGKINKFLVMALREPKM